MIIVLRIANPHIILRQITNLPQLRTSAATGQQRTSAATGFFFSNPKLFRIFAADFEDEIMRRYALSC